MTTPNHGTDYYYYYYFYYDDDDGQTVLYFVLRDLNRQL